MYISVTTKSHRWICISYVQFSFSYRIFRGHILILSSSITRSTKWLIFKIFPFKIL